MAGNETMEGHKSMNTPLSYIWDGEAFAVLARHQLAADRQFTIGQTYKLDVVEERSAVSHSHYFAALNEAWSNLPDDLAERFQTVEHLRKYALIKAGYFDERSIVCASKAEASRVAAFVKPMDDFAIVATSEATVRVFTAKSQAVRAMGKEVFQDSKTKVLEIVADMIGTSRAQLSQAGRAA